MNSNNYFANGNAQQAASSAPTSSRPTQVGQNPVVPSFGFAPVPPTNLVVRNHVFSGQQDVFPIQYPTAQNASHVADENQMFVTTAGKASAAAVLVPDLTLSKCSMCQIGETLENETIIATLRFTCSSNVPVVEQDSSSWVKFAIMTQAGTQEFDMYFRVGAGRKGTGVVSKTCLKYRLGHNSTSYAHVRALNGSEIFWNPREHFVMFASGERYTVEVLARDPSESCQIIPYFADSLLSDLNYVSAADSSPAIGPIVAEENAVYTYNQLPKTTGKRRNSSGSPKAKKMKLSKSSEADKDANLELTPNLDAPGKAACEISNLPNLVEPCSFGAPIGAYTFDCSLQDGPKNLRKKASIIDITISSGGVSTSYAVKFKVYADSTIRRGKRPLRRNCFTFPIDEFHVLHIMCLSSQASRKSLKWTQEKKERFLAFEAGMSFALRVFSRLQGEDCEVNLVQNSNLISLWSDLLHPERNIVHEQPTHSRRSRDGGSLPDWMMEPQVWNLSLNKAPKFYATIISNNFTLPVDPPKVYFILAEKDVEVKIDQYDHRHKRSFIISVPRLFSVEKAEEATRQGVTFSRKVDMLVVGSDNSRLWESTFTYEVGMHE